MQRMEAQIPLAFLLQSRHLDIAERVALRAMCQVLRRHHARVVRATFAQWFQRTVTLRVLEQLAQQEVLTRQAALAHACAIVRRKVNLRMLSTMNVWRQDTLRLRAIEHDASARILQRIWRRYYLLTRFQRLAMLYRARHRLQAVEKIQSVVRMFLAKVRCRELVHLRKQNLAATCIQNCYRNYQMRRIAWKQRRILAATHIERVYRGFEGRKVSNRRRIRCHEAAITMVNYIWTTTAISRVVRARIAVSRIQHWFRVCNLRWRVDISMVILHQRRRFFPAWKIQQTWRRYRGHHIHLILVEAVTAIATLFESAATSIQRAFRAYMNHKKAICTFRLVKIFRCFCARRVVTSRQLQWLDWFLSTKLTRWIEATSFSSVRNASLIAHLQRINNIKNDQRSPTRRLRARCIFSLMIALKAFATIFENSHALQIQRKWRWNRFVVLVGTLRSATFLLQRAIPPLFNRFKQRRRRQRVLARWKRERYVRLRSAFAQWKNDHLLLAHARDLERARNKVQKAKWFRHLKLRKRILSIWRTFVQYRHAKTDRLTCVRLWHKKKLVGGVFAVWARDAMAILVPENVVKEQVLVLEAWHKLQLHQKKQLCWKTTIAWRNLRVKRRTWASWIQDLIEHRAATSHAIQYADSKLLRRSLSAWNKRRQLMCAGNPIQLMQVRQYAVLICRVHL